MARTTAGTRSEASTRTVAGTRHTVRDFGTCLHFTASSTQFVEITNNSGLQINGAITLSLWVKLDKVKTNSEVIFSADDASNRPLYRLQLSNPASTFRFTTTNSGLISVLTDSTTIPVTGKWYFVTVVFDGSVNTIYVNGVLENTSAGYTKATLTLSTARIGTWRGGSPYTDGYIDDVRIYNTNLSAAQISDLYYGIEPPTTNLKGWWKLNEGSGTSAIDSSGNANTGTLTNTPTYSSDVFMNARATA